MIETLISDESSRLFHQSRKGLVDKNGRSYLNFIDSLPPKYWVVWRDIGLGYFAVILTLIVVNFVSGDGFLGIATIFLCAISVGYWYTYISLFIHEAAHRNIANSKFNDNFANIFLCWLGGVDIASYRRVHFEHHRFLGMCNDTENSYFNEPTLWFMFKTLLGLHALQIIVKRKKKLGHSVKSLGFWFVFLYSIFLHVLILTVLIVNGLWLVVLAWGVGVYVFFPFFATMRQILEHRDIKSSTAKNYHTEPHGAIGRIFGNDLFSITFGAAGFNRHLLHHWEPKVSYSRLKELEDFLLKTDLAPVIESSRCNYWVVFRDLCRGSRGKV